MESLQEDFDDPFGSPLLVALGKNKNLSCEEFLPIEGCDNLLW